MQFNIRAIAVLDAVAADARVELSDHVGSQFEFRTGVRLAITLPSASEKFDILQDPSIMLSALSAWARVYRFPAEGGETIHVLAPRDAEDGQLTFLRLDFFQPSWRRGPRPQVEILGGTKMDYDETANWLIDLAHGWSLRPDEKNKQLTLVRPFSVRLNRVRLAWVGPEAVAGAQTASRLDAIGNVFGADIIKIHPLSYSHVKAFLNEAVPLNGVIICRRFANYITADAVPGSVDRNLIHFCDSDNLTELESQVRTWIDICDQAVEVSRAERFADENEVMLGIMLRGMLSHSKIGQFNHCQKQTVLLGARSRRLNVAFAEQVLDENTEAYRETVDSTALFQCKEHNDGRRYFLNPSQMERIRRYARRE